MGENSAMFLIVTVPVANLRREPADAPRGYARDEFQESQVLFNETLLYKREQDGWLLVEAREQPKWNGREWQGYPGWIRKECATRIESLPQHNGVVHKPVAALYDAPSGSAAPLLYCSLGTRLTIVDQALSREGLYYEVALHRRASAYVPKDDVTLFSGAKPSRSNVVSIAALFTGVPYLWGGRSMFMADLTDTITGVDCSGLSNLVYRANNRDIPRDAHDQWLSARMAGAGEEQSMHRFPGEGDLIFVSSDVRSGSVNHVMISTGGESFIDADVSGSTAREKTFREKFGVDLARLKQLKFAVKGKQIYVAGMEVFAAGR